MPTGLVFKRKLIKEPTQGQLDDKAFRQSQQRYQDRGFGEEQPEEQAETDLNIAQLLKKRRRGGLSQVLERIGKPDM